MIVFLAAITIPAIMMASAAQAHDFLADLHGRSNVTCQACHGNTMPAPGDTVSNDRCLVCHSNYQELTKNRCSSGDAACPDPHNSHLGDIDCALCHHGHSASTVYCLQCHKTFALSLPEASEK